MPPISPRSLALLILTVSPLVLSAQAVSLAATPSPAAPSSPIPTPPNILFILADDLGYGDLGCYGQKVIQTPNVDRLATQGTRFTQFYAGAPVCAPSRTVLMTGQHTGHAQIRGNAKVDLRPEDTTVAQVLQHAGYTTALIGKWGLGSEGSAGTPNKKGFDYFFGYIDQTQAHNYYPAFLIRNETRVPLRNIIPNPGKYGQGVATTKLDYSDDLFIAEALQFLDQNKSHPFYLYYAATLPHANDEAKPDGMEIPSYGIYADKNWPSTEKGYAAMVTRLDTDTGRLLAELDKLGLTNNTIVIFTSDNGPHSEGGHSAAFFNSAGGLRGIKRDVYEGGIREPLVVRWPGHVPVGAVSKQVGYFADWLPTAAAIAGAASPAKLDGVSLLPAWLGQDEKQPAHAYLYWEFYEGTSSQAVRWGDWKAVRIPMLTGPVQLYNLATDPAEQHDVAVQNPDIVARLRAIMNEAHVPSPLWVVPASAAPAPAN